MRDGERVGGRFGMALRYLLLGFLLASGAATIVAAMSPTAGTALFAAALALASWRSLRAGVIVGDADVTILGFWRDRHVDWSDVRAFSWSRPTEGAVMGVVPVRARMRLVLRSGEATLLPLWATMTSASGLESRIRDHAIHHGVTVDELAGR